MYQTNMQEGMVAETVNVQGHKGDTINAYYARPSGAGPYPGMVIIHHAPGWDEWYRECARRYAHHGYAVVAIGLRARQGDGLHWRRLTALLRHRGVAPPPRHVIRTEVDAAIETQRLTEFLSGYDLPGQERRRWRV